MKKKFVQRIKKHYVGDDCIQIMIPHLGNSITILNSDGITYHSSPNYKTTINKYMSDDRKEQFPYSKIPTHKKLNKEYINQLFDFEKTYIEIGDSCIKENFVVKDGDEALLMTNFILPKLESSQILSCSELANLFRQANGNVYSLDGNRLEYPYFKTQNEILQRYKEQMRIVGKQELSINNVHDPNLRIFFGNGIDKLTISDVPSGFYKPSDRVLVFIENGEIKSIKGICMTFDGPSRYLVKTYDFPITIYSYEEIKEFEQICSLKTPEIKINKFLNPRIDKNIIKEEKEKAKILRFGVPKKEDLILK